MTLLPHAIAAQQKGFWIFPLPPGEKSDPRLRWSMVATNDLGRIIRWWMNMPMANIGVACKQSKLLVVDCDRPKEPLPLADRPEWKHLPDKHGDTIDGELVYHDLWQRHSGNWDNWDTYQVATPSGGVHYYYRWPHTLKASQAPLCRGLLDIRSNGGQDGGYVLAEGSQDTRGDYKAIARLPIRDCPLWLAKLVAEPPRPPRMRPPPTPADTHMTGGSGWQGLANTVQSAPEGNRNATLHWAACTIRDEGGTEDQAIDTLLDAAHTCGLSERETLATIRSAYRRAT